MKSQERNTGRNRVSILDMNYYMRTVWLEGGRRKEAVAMPVPKGNPARVPDPK